jgi:hypothetical protein
MLSVPCVVQKKKKKKKGEAISPKYNLPLSHSALSFLHHPHFSHQLHLMPQPTPANTKSSTVGCGSV